MREVFDTYMDCLTKDLLEFFEFFRGKNVVSLRDLDTQTLNTYPAYLQQQGYDRPIFDRKLCAVRSFYQYLKSEELIFPVPELVTNEA